MKCGDPPEITELREVWEVKVFAWGASCKVLHDECSNQLSQSD